MKLDNLPIITHQNRKKHIATILVSSPVGHHPQPTSLEGHGVSGPGAWERNSPIEGMVRSLLPQWGQPCIVRLETVEL